MQVKTFFVKMDLDDNHLDLVMVDGKQCKVSNHETLKNKSTHKEAWELAVPTNWHDDVVNSLFFPFPIFMNLARQNE